MENPCKTCIIKVNCTEVCFAKENFEVLLENAIKKFEINTFEYLRSIKLQEQYNKYFNLLVESRVDIIMIKGRCRSTNV